LTVVLSSLAADKLTVKTAEVDPVGPGDTVAPETVREGAGTPLTIVPVPCVMNDPLEPTNWRLKVSGAS